ncbi:MAG TPA: hypothetical protein VD772_08380 [Anseongella sp.]|nr:hypothetical protein [Anseongella sp.]
MNPALRIIFLLALFTGFSCEEELPFNKVPTDPAELIEYNKFKTTIEQGLSGTLLFSEGQCGPALDTNAHCSIYPVSRKIRLYEFTVMDQTEPGEGTFFTEVDTKLIGTTQSDETGFYQIALQPGRYSMFIEENGLLYANGVGNDGGILVSVVDSGWVTMTHPEITYKADY